jgi:hypothetical protein
MKFVVAIENKVDSKAGDGQLDRYAEYLKSSYPEHKRLMVFLTPDATPPDHEGYIAYDYADVVSTLESLTSSPHELVPSETRLVIQHFVDMVRKSKCVSTPWPR